nr:BTAD domain-containing putative transcriptional regulator [Tsukamurella sp. 1534]
MVGDGPGAELARRARRARDVLENRAALAALESRDYSAARALAERRVADDPIDEPARVLLMRALAGEGRTAEALAAYADLRRTLAAELGMDPGDEAERVHRALLASTAEGPAPTRESGGPAGPFGLAQGLTAESTPLVGRKAELADLRRAVVDHRAVTVLGPGGVGKTRVAESVGRAVAAGGTEVHYVPLASVRDAEDVVAAVARAIGVAETEFGADGRPRVAVGDLGELLLSTLRDRRCLLVLDNCEQVIDGCAALVAELIATAPEVAVLVTSRSPLQIRAEQVYPLPVLGAEGAGSAAVELFRQRALAVRPDAHLDPDAVARLCRRVDGLPLAIELAAARVRTMTVAEIADRLSERFALLRSSDRTAPDRHRTLHAVIEWSWDLLDDDARTALRRLCRFPAGFDAAAAERVASMAGVRLDDALASLVNQSLLHVSEAAGRARYRMLETVREFGEERLGGAGARGAPSEFDVVDEAMAAWARNTAIDLWETYRAGGGRTVIARLTGDFENLVFVLRGAVSRLEGGDERAAPTVISVFPLIAGLWVMRGLHAQLQDWGERVLAALPAPPPVLTEAERERWQAVILACAADLATDPTSRRVARGRVLLRRLHRAELTLRRPGDFASAMFLAHSSFTIMRQVLAGVAAAEPEVRLPALALRMNLRENNGDLVGALADSATIRSSGDGSDPWFDALVAMTTSSIYGQQALWDDAERGYRRAITQLESIGADEDARQARGYLVASLCCLGRIDEAEEQYRRLANGWTPDAPDPNGGPEVVAAMMLGGAEIARLRGEPDGARYIRAGELLIRRIPDGTRDPGSEMLLSVALLGAVACGSGASARPLASALVAGEHAMFGAAGYWDLPQAATMALAMGEYLDSVGGAEDDTVTLYRLAVRLGARQDYPVMRAAKLRATERVSGERVLSRAAAVHMLRGTVAGLRTTGLVD